MCGRSGASAYGCRLTGLIRLMGLIGPAVSWMLAAGNLP
jgi:hypothetical protein